MFFSMTYSVKFQNTLYNISKSLANTLLNKNFISETVNKQTIFLLNDHNVWFFLLVVTGSPTHFYISFLQKKFRVSKNLFTVLKSFLNKPLTNVKKWEPSKFDETVVSPLAWAGNKSKLNCLIYRTIPSAISSFYEPFLGSGSVLFYVLQQQNKGNLKIKNGIYASDLNVDLINFFKVIQRMPTEFYYVFMSEFVLPYKKLENFEAKSQFFYQVRFEFNSNLGQFNLVQAARFLFLNKTGYGGLFRVNSKGFFNVPFGRKTNPKFLTEASLLKISELIADVKFTHGNFHEQMLNYEKNAFFFLDPPYVKLANSSFVGYQSTGFSNDDFFLLSNFCENLNDNGCFFTLTNSFNEITLNFAANHKSMQFSTNSFQGHCMRQLLITNAVMPAA